MVLLCQGRDHLDAAGVRSDGRDPAAAVETADGDDLGRVAAQPPGRARRRRDLNGARYLGRLDRIGTIEAGKRAGLVVRKGDPTRRIADLENVEIVFKDGYGHDPVKLNASVRGMVGIR